MYNIKLNMGPRLGWQLVALDAIPNAFNTRVEAREWCDTRFAQIAEYQIVGRLRYI